MLKIIILIFLGFWLLLTTGCNLFFLYASIVFLSFVTKNIDDNLIRKLIVPVAPFACIEVSAVSWWVKSFILSSAQRCLNGNVCFMREVHATRRTGGVTFDPCPSCTRLIIHTHQPRAPPLTDFITFSPQNWSERASSRRTPQNIITLREMLFAYAIITARRRKSYRFRARARACTESVCKSCSNQICRSWCCRS